MNRFYVEWVSGLLQIGTANRRAGLAGTLLHALTSPAAFNPATRIAAFFGSDQDNKMKRVAIGPIVISLFAVGCATAPPSIDTSPTAEVTFDGLHEVLNSRADKAWARPDVDFSGYSKIMLQGAGVEYRPGGEAGRTYAARSRGGPYEVTEEQKARFEEAMREVFAEELQRSERFELVNEAGPDVLLVRGALLDVVSYVPPDNIPGRVDVYLSSVGEATLVIEIRDSITEAILARAIDRDAADDMSGSFMESNRVTNRAEVRRLARRWATSLREGLETVTAQ